MEIDLTKKEFQIKKKHHYIWGFYLSQWSINNEVYYISKSGKIASGSVKGLSCERGFYKVHPLTKEDIAFIVQFSKKSPDSLHKVHMKFFSNFIEISKRLHLKNVLNIESPEIHHLCQVLAYNTLEDLHTHIESKALPILEELWRDNPKILLNNENITSFCSFIGHQMTRTKSFKELAFSIFKQDDFYTKKYPNYRLLFERNWWFLSFILGINLGASFLFDNTSKHIFVVNKTEVPFVTSDNPAINVHPSLPHLVAGDDPKQMDLFYPLSPCLAYMINESGEYDNLKDSVSKNDVTKLNEMIALKSDKTLFSNSTLLLKELKEYKAHNE